MTTITLKFEGKRPIIGIPGIWGGKANARDFQHTEAQDIINSLDERRNYGK